MWELCTQIEGLGSSGQAEPLIGQVWVQSNMVHWVGCSCRRSSRGGGCGCWLPYRMQLSILFVIHNVLHNTTPACWSLQAPHQALAKLRRRYAATLPPPLGHGAIGPHPPPDNGSPGF